MFSRGTSQVCEMPVNIFFITALLVPRRFFP
jgi:hypothetical protein